MARIRTARAVRDRLDQLVAEGDELTRVLEECGQRMRKASEVRTR